MLRRKGIFDVVLLALMLLAFSSAVFSAELGKRGKKEYMGVCDERESGMIYVITNGSNANSCSKDQAVGSTRIYCSCDEESGVYSWTPLVSAIQVPAGTQLATYLKLVVQDEPPVDCTAEGSANVVFAYNSPGGDQVCWCDGTTWFSLMSGSLTNCPDQAPPE